MIKLNVFPRQQLGRSILSGVKNLIMIDHLLRDREQFFVEIKRGSDLPVKMRAMLGSSGAALALYGALLGSTHSGWPKPERRGQIALVVPGDLTHLRTGVVYY